MFLHMLFDTVQVLEETYMTQLVDLIMADDLYGHRFLYPVQIVLGCGDTADTCSCKTDLGGGSKFKNHVLFSVCLAHGKHLRQMILLLFLIIQMMYTVGIVPVNTEIFCCRT